MLRALIVEDERGSRDRLKRLLARHASDVCVVGEADSGPAALDLVESVRPNLVFLDVALPGFDGFALLDEIDASVKVIFTTASQEHAVRAWDTGAVHYLLKPIDADQLKEALSRLQRRPSSHASPATRRILCRDRDMTHVLRTDEILFVKADQGYTLVRTETKEFLTSDSLGTLEDQMGRTLVRIHRNALVNIAHITSLRHLDGEVLVVLRNGLELPVSRRHGQTLRDRLLAATD